MSKLALYGGRPIRKRPFIPWPLYDKEEIRYLREVLRTRRWCVSQYGNRSNSMVGQFEEKFAKYHNARYGLAVANGTAALEISLKACDVGIGDEVIVPSYTFYSTASAVLQLNAVPIFVDIDPDTYCINPDKIEEAITDKTKAIIPVHFGGYPADMDKILKIARRYKLRVIEDAAQAHGTIWRDKKIGTLGDLGTFSFQASKNITSGEGGIILTNNKRLYELCYSFHTLGRFKKGGWYNHYYLGWNYRLSEFQGAVLLAQLKRLEAQTKLREKNAGYLTKKLLVIKGLYPFVVKDKRVTRTSYHLYIIRVNPKEFGCSIDFLIKALNAENIPIKKGYEFPLYRNPVFLKQNFGRSNYLFRNIDYNKIKCVIAERMCRELLWIHHSILLGNARDMDDIVNAFIKIKKNI